MIREFCDRCSCPVGKMYDGGKDEVKHQIDDVLSTVGINMKRDSIVCQNCFTALQRAMRTWWETK